MPPRRRRLIVRVRRPGVKHVFVGQELDIADFEDHVQGQALACVLEHVDGFELSGREGRDDAVVGEAGEGADVVWVPSL